MKSYYTPNINNMGAVINKFVVVKHLSEVSFKWFNHEGKEVPYGNHVPYLFEVECDGIDKLNVTKVILPECDYTNPDKDPLVLIHCRTITFIDPNQAWEIKNEKNV